VILVIREGLNVISRRHSASQFTNNPQKPEIKASTAEFLRAWCDAEQEYLEGK